MSENCVSGINRSALAGSSRDIAAIRANAIATWRAVTLKHNETIHVTRADWPLWTERAFFSFLSLSLCALSFSLFLCFFSLSLFLSRRRCRRCHRQRRVAEKLIPTSVSASTSAFPGDLADYDTLVNTHPRICTYLHTCAGVQHVESTTRARRFPARERRGEETRKYLGPRERGPPAGGCVRKRDTSKIKRTS